jgi:hypothetical protein
VEPFESRQADLARFYLNCIASAFNNTAQHEVQHCRFPLLQGANWKNCAHLGNGDALVPDLLLLVVLINIRKAEEFIKCIQSSHMFQKAAVRSTLQTCSELTWLK